MGQPDSRTTVVVGIDGSENSRAASVWAERWFGCAASIHLVSVGEIDESFMSDVLGPADAPAPQRLTGDPAQAIVKYADEVAADLVVLGAHGWIPHLPHTIGSVTHKVLRLATCPVAVVTARDSSDIDPSAPIIVGIGDGRATTASVAWAVRAAERRGVGVHFVRAIDPHPIFGLDDPVDALASYLEPRQLVVWADKRLAELAATLETSGVEVTTQVAFGSAGAALVQASAAGSLLAIGKHFDGPLSGYLTSRTLHTALVHAHSPVVVVPGNWKQRN